jgi:sugar-specific transcriptional regulator TrmB
MDALQSLVSLGFTPLEAEVYVCLVQDSPATGYRVAQAVGRPVAGIYKTIESLANKGAVVLDDGESRLCRAVPPAELLARLPCGRALVRDTSCNVSRSGRLSM